MNSPSWLLLIWMILASTVQQKSNQYLYLPQSTSMLTLNPSPFMNVIDSSLNIVLSLTNWIILLKHQGQVLFLQSTNLLNFQLIHRKSWPCHNVIVHVFECYLDLRTLLQTRLILRFWMLCWCRLCWWFLLWFFLTGSKDPQVMLWLVHLLCRMPHCLGV